MTKDQHLLSRILRDAEREYPYDKINAYLETELVNAGLLDHEWRDAWATPDGHHPDHDDQRPRGPKLPLTDRKKTKTQKTQ